VKPLCGAPGLEAIDDGLNLREDRNQLDRHVSEHRDVVKRIVTSAFLEAIDLLLGRNVSEPKPYRGCFQRWPQKSGCSSVFARLYDAYQGGMMLHRQVDGATRELRPPRD